ncbi:MAG: hypothetical protein KGM42_04850 [Hyphomicrobiales bacterium]|nr:hypothetical protein [Hyphomicrobiales bacterium]
MRNTKCRSPGAKVTVMVTGPVTISKVDRKAAGIRPGDRVVSRALPNGTVVIERARPAGLVPPL